MSNATTRKIQIFVNKCLRKILQIYNNNNNNDLLTDPLGGSSLLNYINYNYKINQIKLFSNYTVDTGLTESNYSKTN